MSEEQRFETVEKAIHFLENTYDRGGKYLVDGRPRYIAAAVRMEDETGLKNIAGRYNFVDGKEAPFAEYDYRKRFRKFCLAEGFLQKDDPIQVQAGQHFAPEFPKALKEINEEHKKLREMNPELSKLKFDSNSITESYHALIGVTSQYNPEDVNAYLEYNIRKGHINWDMQPRIKKVQQETGMKFGWQPAESTMQSIEQQVEERQKAAAKTTEAKQETSESRFDTVEKAAYYLENAYDRKGKYMVDGRPKYIAQAVRMEDEMGLTDIAGRYKFVDGKEAAFAEYDYRKKFLKYSLADGFLKQDDPIKHQAANKFIPEFPKALQEINGELTKLTELNPELKKLNYNKNSIIESYRALIGVTSQYNPDDINAYLHSVRTGKKDPDVMSRIDKLQKTTKLRFGWQPAVSTMDKIEKQVAVRQKALVQQKAGGR